MKNKIIAGIELGSSKTSVIVAQISIDETTYTKSINVIGVSSTESKGIKKGQIVNIEESVESAISAIEGAERMAGHNITDAYVSLGGAHIHSQNSHGVVAISGPNGEIVDSDVERSLEAASAISLPTSREIVHVLPREFVVDGESGVKDPIGMTGVRLEVETHVVTASSAAIKNLNKTLTDAGIKINDLVFSGLASAYSVLSETEKELGCCLIDIGAGTTSVVAYIDGSLAYSGVIPVGAKNVTNDIAIGLRVSLETAEKIKLYLSQNKKVGKDIGDEIDLNSMGISEVTKVSKKTLIEGIIRPRLNEIFTMVRLELEREKIINKIPSGAIVTGGGAKTVGVTDSAKRMLVLPVRIGIPTGVSGLIDDVLDPIFSVPIGLLIYGVKDEMVENSGSFRFPVKLNIPGKGLFHKIIESIKDLLP
ncbi:cell division protein FtsA [Candidatus Woesebacteria bacterium GWC2_33_12]|uniref:Cell division protein FtsA n=1 Tax=Candidatus Woesebacteria bacterium GW2011_GWB1_33_22 TaxID=1618566 RepID=A0A0F9ZMR5_9BACT|nr:MAG: Cell division protein ftsA [Candidatus Woesebacteria bacterium GW2011_GWC2_33_12]KKP42682.1 MAG: Cell division protein ftsA [Candidatus Woesebacteria bacterium GW2011_GWA2_33_20]KKP45543.1 MAG: Cell division protein ftsA [Candidatus Woesebacteria bacterium GW2011_GWB1_33_22]KKP47415.1 MAG: Cell division protein ftsA [Microgenomates group bacterium GW2011_GWC1_33_28]KKP51161.1 MAG: Cell division protein ftsA [Candidatus Woesebacteria bacterium GW2011_GWA1_33_33]OGM06951.1 MAG: cell divi